MLAIEVDKIVKQYKNGVKALDGLSLQVKKGEIFSLLGPNGAGKSSLINILTTFYKPTSGKINILGKDLCKEPAWVRTQIACVAQRVSIDEHLSLMENMTFQSRMYRVDKYTAKKRIKELIDSFQLLSYLRYPTSSYSGGVKRRLDIAMNMVSLPKILFLDEPTVGMDAVSRNRMWEMLLKIRDEYNTTIFLTTHYLEEADQLSDNICIMNNGKEIAQGTSSSLRNIIRQNMIRVVLPNAIKAKKYKKMIDNTDFIKWSNIKENSIVVGVANSRKSLTLINKWMIDNNMEFISIGIVEPTLEDVFVSLVNSDRNRGEGLVC
ncbi:ABC transporter ATP-binding protein [Vallitalea longa]|uniref:ABC transporter ATP-binding protein n=1 Tax=Vallitalea longa TaxID=2936439 RepID=A0A9W6DEM2_9FIRM|nr:ABC transporter ATP-binding protein [Vallitalea longa]GKX29670.1 ABC transporter ATP-binding protein [Vallitalea longa]